MSPTPNLEPGDLVQLNPETVGNEHFGACIMVVTEAKSFGAQGYVQSPGHGQAYYRARWEEMEIVGRAVWTVGD